jgi:Na+/H+ antiporter NhaD/arsenite permease-like protein
MGHAAHAIALATVSVPPFAARADGGAAAGLPVEFLLFAGTLLGIAVFHRHSLGIALSGLASITLYKIFFTGFVVGSRFFGLAHHVSAEVVTLTNLLGLLLGFAVIAQQFERSGLPLWLPRYLPRGWMGPFSLLMIVFVLSGFLDNIAAALIGGAIAQAVFRAKVHVGYLAGIVAAANAGGAGSVVGDTTTTMMWIAGVSPLIVAPAYVAAGVAVVVCGIPASLQQNKYSPMTKGSLAPARIDWVRVGIVASILVVAISTGVFVNTRFPNVAHSFPFVAVALWIALFASAPLRCPDWGVLRSAFKGALFLLALVLCASLMPVDRLPPPTWHSTFGLGVLSAIFDNIPLTALALKQGGYDWSTLAYAVGFGGSMLWFGSSAGVALSNMFPEARSVGRWLRSGWHVVVAYVLGHLALLWTVGWHPAAS